VDDYYRKLIQEYDGSLKHFLNFTVPKNRKIIEELYIYLQKNKMNTQHY